MPDRVLAKIVKGPQPGAQPGAAPCIPPPARSGSRSPFLPLPPVPEPDTSWIGRTLIDQNEAPVPGRPYRVVAAHRRVYEGTLDEEGMAVVQGLENGLCKVSCPAVTPHASLTYTVSDGDRISGIALQRGFDDYSVVWNRPEKADLRADPHVLASGDSRATKCSSRS